MQYLVHKVSGSSEFTFCLSPEPTIGLSADFSWNVLRHSVSFFVGQTSSLAKVF